MRDDVNVIVKKIVRIFQLGVRFVFDFRIEVRNMLACKCFYWSRITDLSEPRPDYFSLPDPIPQWPQGSGFSSKIINLGELEVCQITKFEYIWGCNTSTDGKEGISFYKPIGIPNGFFSLGHHCHSNKKPLHGFVLAARIATKIETQNTSIHNSNFGPPLLNPLDYSLVWSSNDGGNENFDRHGYFWLPQPPEGYKALGFVVTNISEKPNLDEVKCVRSDLTDTCEAYRVILNTNSCFLNVPLLTWSLRPLHRGIYGRGVSVGTFFASSYWAPQEELSITCLKNLDHSLHAMPNINQMHALIRHYGPRVYFHPDEVYLPSSVSWFFRNGAILYNNSESHAENIDSEGSNLPSEGTNDGKYWIDLPSDNRRENVKHGNLESVKLYIHVKPALGGTFTDIVMWVFCPFNGPARLKVGVMNIYLSKIGQHVGDWEHFTLRISNFTGELQSIYFSQHSGGEWIDAFDLEFIKENKAIVYSSKSGHASFPHPGTHIQGSSKLGIGIRNDAGPSDYYVDSSERYEIVAAEYLGDGVVNEPCWLQYMRKWGPSIVYDSKTELDKIIKNLPAIVRNSVENVFNKLPLELYREEGPTGPKEKNNWIGDERW